MLDRQIKLTVPKLPKAFMLDQVVLDECRLSQAKVNQFELAESSLDELTIEQSAVGKLTGLGCQFKRLSLIDAVVEEGDLAGISVSEFSLTRCSIRVIRLTGAQLPESDWGNVSLTNCKGDLLNLRFSTFQNVRFEDINFKQVDFSSARFSNVLFEDCDLEGAIFRGCKMQNTYFSNCNLIDIEGASGLAGSTIEESQLITLGPSLARELQINIQAITEP